MTQNIKSSLYCLSRSHGSLMTNYSYQLRSSKEEWPIIQECVCSSRLTIPFFFYIKSLGVPQPDANHNTDSPGNPLYQAWQLDCVHNCSGIMPGVTIPLLTIIVMDKPQPRLKVYLLGENSQAVHRPQHQEARPPGVVARSCTQSQQPHVPSFSGLRRPHISHTNDKYFF